MKTFSLILASLCTALLATSCVTPPPPPTKPLPGAKPTPKPTYWKSDGIVGSPKIEVRLWEQRAYFYKGDTLVGETPISSGRKGFETPPGNYKVIQKDEKHVSNLYGNFVDEAGVVVKKDVDASKDKPPEGAVFAGAKMPYFLRFHNGYGMHAGRLPGYRASHGCVRLPRSMAMHFYQNAAIGTPVILEGQEIKVEVKKPEPGFWERMREPRKDSR